MSETTEGTPLRGHCNCGAVQFSLHAPLTEASACHCGQCRRQSGHFFASANLPRSAVQLQGAEHLRWYQMSDKARRGFCGHCGCWLFWDPLHHDWTSVALGSIEGATGIRLQRHIFVADKGDYYEIADGLPQNAQ